MASIARIRVMGDTAAVAAVMLAISKGIEREQSLEIAEISEDYDNRRGGGVRRYITVIVHSEDGEV